MIALRKALSITKFVLIVGKWGIKMNKRGCFLIGFLLLGIILQACTKGVPAKTEELQQITYVEIGYEPAGYDVYVITSEEITAYNLTDYWLSSPDDYSYLEDGLPTGDKLTAKQVQTDENDWETLKQTLVQYQFYDLPSELEKGDVKDANSHYIQAVTDSGSHSCGGYGIAYADHADNLSFTKIQLTIKEMLIQYFNY